LSGCRNNLHLIEVDLHQHRWPIAVYQELSAMAAGGSKRLIREPRRRFSSSRPCIPTKGRSKMTFSKPDWKTNEKLAVGKGATAQEFFATVGRDKLVIDVAPWGEGRLKVNGREIAHLDHAKDRRQAFRELKKIAERYLEGRPVEVETRRKSSRIPAVKAKLLEGKKGLVIGIANENSIAWGCAKAFRAFGADLAVTYLNEKAKKYVEPLASELEASIVMPLDVNAPGQMEAVFERIAKEWNKLDFVVHSIAFSPKDALQGRVVDVSQDGFQTTMNVSCWTFIRMAHLAEPLMRKGGTLFTMTYYGSQMVVKNYNIMGVAKAALECAVRYIAAELGPKGIRVHAISPGPLATRAASGIPAFDALLDKAKAKAPARSLVSIDDVGVATAFLAHDAARLITGETLYVDGGYHIID
jgi:enoyl-[acyl-carrier protein] reductase I